MKNTKKSLLASSISLVLSLALMVGTTFAWFTSSVKSNDNTITAGMLNMEGYAYSSVEMPEEGGITVTIEGFEYSFASEGQNLKEDNKASIDDSNFDPGKISAKLYEVKNAGTLDFKFRFQFINCNDGGLGEKLWFAFVPLDNGIPAEIEKKDLTLLGQCVGNETVLAEGESQKYILLYGLKDAVNKEECIGLDFKFDIDILATQDDGQFPTIPEDEIVNENIY